MKCCLKGIGLLLGVAMATGTGAGETANVPFCSLRIDFHYTQPENWPGLRAALEKNRAAFDEVWFSTGISFPKMSWHEEHARQCAAAAADLRKLGIVPSIEIQAIIGHLDSMLVKDDCTGQNWTKIVSADGLPASRMSCPRDPNLIAYFTRVAELHAAWKPGSVWVDDDMSYRNRAPLLKDENYLPGCFCDRCLAGFAKIEKRAWTRDELTKAIRADAEVRRRWDDYSCAGMGETLRVIAEAIHRLSPETVMGYQYGGGMRLEIPKGLYAGSGHPVRLRPGAGAYWDTDAHGQILKAYGLQRMIETARKEAWIGACCPEITTCPRTFSCRTPQGLILESFENLALGMDFISMFIADAGTGEATAFYADRLFPRLAAAHPFLKGYQDANAGTRPCGFTPPRGTPARLVPCRGVPIVGPNHSLSLGELPSFASIKACTPFLGDLDERAPEYQTRVMQVASTVGLTNYYAQCVRASGERLPVQFEYPVMAFMLPRVCADGTLATVALVNASIDRQEPVVLRLRGVPSSVKTARWHQPEAEPVVLKLEREGDVVRVRLPRVGAWECGYLALRDGDAF